MIQTENHCIGCPKDIGCIGTACRYVNVVVCYCDECGNDEAIYEINGQDFCANCVEEYLKNVFDSLSITEKAKILSIDLNEISY